MTFQEVFEYACMCLMCVSFTCSLIWMAVEIKNWGADLSHETRYIDTGYTCTDKY